MTGKRLSLAGMILWLLLAVMLSALLCFALFSGGLSLWEGGWLGLTFSWSDDGGAVVLRQEQTFSVDELSRVTLEGLHHDVYITFTDASTVTVREYASERWPESRLVAIRREGGALSVIAPHPQWWGWGWLRGLSGAGGRLELALPARFRGDLSAQTVSGHLKWTGECTLTELALSTVSGALDLTGRVTADRVSLGSISGHIQADTLTSDSYRLSSVSGSIEAASLSGRGSVRTTSGSLHLTLDELTGDCSLESISGSVSLSLPADSAFRYDLNSVSGRIRSDFPLVLDGDTLKSRISGSVGDAPVHRVDIETVSGSIRLIRLGD
ncbi:MAG: DUF4097 domain-containing protein [Oscillospiraceae bacterium]|jgi:hypothetical protein|nr:DUF4097 domain-containing protein [Oscillospiraceae bacterium]